MKTKRCVEERLRNAKHRCCVLDMAINTFQLALDMPSYKGNKKAIRKMQDNVRIAKADAERDVKLYEAHLKQTDQLDVGEE